MVCSWPWKFPQLFALPDSIFSAQLDYIRLTVWQWLRLCEIWPLRLCDCVSLSLWLWDLCDYDCDCVTFVTVSLWPPEKIFPRNRSKTRVPVAPAAREYPLELQNSHDHHDGKCKIMMSVIVSNLPGLWMSFRQRGRWESWRRRWWRGGCSSRRCCRGTRGAGSPSPSSHRSSGPARSAPRTGSWTLCRWQLWYDGISKCIMNKPPMKFQLTLACAATRRWGRWWSGRWQGCTPASRNS